MHGRTVVAGALFLAALLPTGSKAQSPEDMRYSDGTSRQPWLTPSTRAPSLDVEATGSILSDRTGPLVPPPAGTRVTIDRPGCDVQSYVVGSGSRVRVHRC